MQYMFYDVPHKEAAFSSLAILGYFAPLLWTSVIHYRFYK